MSRTYAFDHPRLFETLETKLSLSSVASGVSNIAATSATRGGDDLPPPGPESDPGDTPGHKDPIVYPKLPETGPVGPG